MQTLIKIDLKTIYNDLIKLNSRIFDVTPIFNNDGTYTIKEWDVTGDIKTILNWFKVKQIEREIQEENMLIQEYKKGNYDYVMERM